MFAVKRVYEDPSLDDGYRVLVDRLWPRGVSKERAQLDEWLKEVAPSTELRQWFNHEAPRFEEFAARYDAELEQNPAVERLRAIAEPGRPAIGRRRLRVAANRPSRGLGRSI
jgi:uncharacterized protein YeaO (DUF488 family)